MAERQPSESIDERASMLMESANALIGEGLLQEAAASLEKAAQLHREAGRKYDEARCSQLAATLRRSVGETGTARTLAEHAASIQVDDLPVAVSIAAETAETAAAENRFEEAAAQWAAAIEKGSQAGMRPDGMSALLRRRAATFIALGRLPEAEADFARAFDLTRSAHGDSTAAFVLIEEANRLRDAGKQTAAKSVVARIEALTATSAPNAHLKAELELLLAGFAGNQGDMQAAESHARQSRSYALEAIAPVTYFSASVQLAEVLQSREDFTQAYGALAAAWATLSDLLGENIAASWVEPCLIAYKMSWGDPQFQEAKSNYEARRCAAMSGKTNQP